jgi:hypothetical protein
MGNEAAQIRSGLAILVGNLFLDVLCCGASLLLGLYRASGANAALDVVLVALWSSQKYADVDAAAHVAVELFIARGVQLASAMSGLYNGALSAIEGKTEAPVSPGFFVSLAFFLAAYVAVDTVIRRYLQHDLTEAGPEAGVFARRNLLSASAHAAAQHLAVALDITIRGASEVGLVENLLRWLYAAAVVGVLVAWGATPGQPPSLLLVASAAAAGTLGGSAAFAWVARSGHAAFADVLLLVWIVLLMLTNGYAAAPLAELASQPRKTGAPGAMRTLRRTGMVFSSALSPRSTGAWGRPTVSKPTGVQPMRYRAPPPLPRQPYNYGNR